uniref:non-specific serine/threonine protein kinase n=1 Tax=Rhizochromulina marina TaxID=1034831 RepID=A0A7S2RTJ7_9STRA|mmetsp:Transcript_20819/g.60860  ORF Transcript_20819/g.60860 Transcript_20819/m.60860 type:complete len:537 (+) Transcript_20819:224-1834(+)
MPTDPTLPSPGPAGLQVMHKLGEGSFGSVFLARRHGCYADPEEDGDAGCLVAVKQVFPTIAPHRVQNEIKHLHHLSGGSPRVPFLFEAFRVQGVCSMVMSFFPHDPFKAYLHRMDGDQIRRYAFELLSALAYVHSKGVVHRDVKPRNFLYNLATGKGCLVDFGLAQESALWDRRKALLEERRRGRDGNEAAFAANTPPPTAASGSSSGSMQATGATAAPTATGPASSAPPPASLRGREPNSKRSRRHEPQNGPSKRSLAANSQGRRLAAAAAAATAAAAAAAGGTSVVPTRVHGRACPLPGPPTRPEDEENDHAESRRVGDGALRPDRAGTPGFRAPEVLLYSMEQSSALDIWSAGVILLSLLSRRYPFFTVTDGSDLPALLQIASVFGVKELKEAAAACCKEIQDLPDELDLGTPSSLSDLVHPALRPCGDSCTEVVQRHAGLVDLVQVCLKLNPSERISASDALEHYLVSVGGAARQDSRGGASGADTRPSQRPQRRRKSSGRSSTRKAGGGRTPSQGTGLGATEALSRGSPRG